MRTKEKNEGDYEGCCITVKLNIVILSNVARRKCTGIQALSLFELWWINPSERLAQHCINLNHTHPINIAFMFIRLKIECAVSSIWPNLHFTRLIIQPGSYLLLTVSFSVRYHLKIQELTARLSVMRATSQPLSWQGQNRSYYCLYFK